NSLVDREAKKRGMGVHLLNRSCALLPPKLASEVCALTPGEERFAVSAVFRVNPLTGSVAEGDAWIGKSVIKSDGKLTLEELDAALSGDSSFTHGTVTLND